MNVNNLTNVYNQNPTLQGQYTLQQYLDLYGGSSTGTTTPTTTTTTTPTTNASQGIINANINQFQNQGGDGGSPVTNTRPSLGYKSSYASTGTTPGENKNYLYDIGVGTIDNDDLTPGLSFKEGIYNVGRLFSNLPTPFNLAKKGMKTFKDYQEKKAKEKAIELQKEIGIANEVAANRARVEAYTGRSMSDYRQRRPRSEQNYTGGSTNSNSSFSNKSGMGRTGYDYGGRVGAKDGGSMIQIVKDRLMEKNPAMWGLGYEGLASLQDLITSMPFNQGGIVNIRRR